ncbi:MAG: class I SAM-dependent methyltransferase [Desulfobaccales bacterium]
MTHPPTPPVPPDWWRHLFDETYLRTDARSVQDEALTRREVDEVIQALDLRRDESILDLCGGQGRHALDMARRGYGRVLVLDFSQPLLSWGRAQAQREGGAVAFVRGDARSLPFGEASLHAVLCLANSFGYGATRGDDLRILEEACRVLSPGGRLYLEVADPGYVRVHLPLQSWHEAPGDLVVCRRRWLTPEHLICREMVLSQQDGLVRDCAYQVRLYEPQDLEAHLKDAGFARVAMIEGKAPDSPPGERGALSRRLAVAAWKE